MMTTFKQIDYKPKDCQFVAMWEYNGKIWSDTVCWCQKNQYFILYDEVNQMYGERFDLSEHAESTVKYFVLEEE